MTTQPSTRTIGLLTAGALLMSGASASATLLLHYTFDNDDAANSGSLGDGTEFGGVTYAASGADGGANAGNAAVFNRTGANDAGIDTSFTAADLQLAGNSFTTAAWISYNGNGEDSIIFGGDPNGNNSASSANSPQIHYGIRNNDSSANLHGGNWADDLQDQGDPVPTDGTWVHVAFTYDGATLTQYLNGAATGTLATTGGLNDAANNVALTIGWTDRDNQGSFDGAIDEVRIYDTVLTAAEIQAVSVIGVPEPTSTSLMALASLGLLLRRRK